MAVRSGRPGVIHIIHPPGLVHSSRYLMLTHSYIRICDASMVVLTYLPQGGTETAPRGFSARKGTFPRGAHNGKQERETVNLNIKSRVREKADAVIAQPIRNANYLAIFACVIACIALVIVTVRK